MWQLSYAPLGHGAAWHREFEDQPAARLALGDIVLGFDGAPAHGTYYLAAPGGRIVATWHLHAACNCEDDSALTLYRQA